MRAEAVFGDHIMSATRTGAFEAISVTPDQESWRWRVEGSTAHLEGAAINRESAASTARFAAGAVDAFARLARRRS